jgi:hypothetical protein
LLNHVARNSFVSREPHVKETFSRMQAREYGGETYGSSEKAS